MSLGCMSLFVFCMLHGVVMPGLSTTLAIRTVRYRSGLSTAYSESGACIWKIVTVIWLYHVDYCRYVIYLLLKPWRPGERAPYTVLCNWMCVYMYVCVCVAAYLPSRGSRQAWNSLSIISFSVSERTGSDAIAVLIAYTVDHSRLNISLRVFTSKLRSTTSVV